MQVKRILQLVVVLVVAVATLPLVAGTAAAASSAACVPPDPKVFNFSVQGGTTYTYTVSVKPGKVTCTAVTFNVGSWTVPATWDGKGTNATAFPQVEFDYATLTYPAGGTGAVTATVRVPSCGPFQTDLYAGARRPSPLLFPSPLRGDRIIGVLGGKNEACGPATSSAPVTSSAPPSSSAPATSSAPASSSVAASTTGTSSSSPSTSVLGEKTSRAHKTKKSPRGTTSVLPTEATQLPHTGGGGPGAGWLVVVGLALLLGGRALMVAARSGGEQRRH